MTLQVNVEIFNQDLNGYQKVEIKNLVEQDKFLLSNNKVVSKNELRMIKVEDHSQIKISDTVDFKVVIKKDLFVWRQGKVLSINGSFASISCFSNESNGSDMENDDEFALESTIILRKKNLRKVSILDFSLFEVSFPYKLKSLKRLKENLKNFLNDSNILYFDNGIIRLFDMSFNTPKFNLTSQQLIIKDYLKVIQLIVQGEEKLEEKN